MKHKIIGIAVIAAALLGASAGCGDKKQDAQLEDLFNQFADSGGNFGTYDGTDGGDGGSGNYVDVPGDGAFPSDGVDNSAYDNGSFETEN